MFFAAKIDNFPEQKKRVRKPNDSPAIIMLHIGKEFPKCVVCKISLSLWDAVVPFSHFHTVFVRIALFDNPFVDCGLYIPANATYQHMPIHSFIPNDDIKFLVRPIYKKVVKLLFQRVKFIKTSLFGHLRETQQLETGQFHNKKYFLLCLFLLTIFCLTSSAKYKNLALSFEKISILIFSLSS
ncbi:hypothetical protein GMAR_ORF91 [Golden Marseillevirus]|uniref:hypothetical protein n=1 Tax=Golden Marseillevirus TaxID=1720526 RepID=UPI000877A981|nr:hypothetical protein GMAR_ORF91 [Golden Marseillevirus]ALX27466.1 hypothetical protein GMAR_ORF91 [Golden Marseillevirus]